MRSFVRARAVLTAATLLATVTATGMATSFAAAQAAGGAAAAASRETDRLGQLRNFLHLVQIARPDTAAAQLEALFDGGLTAAELAKLVDENDLADRFDRAMTRARGMAGLEELAPRIEQMLREGRLELAREPKRIEEAIGMLGGTLRQQMMARERLAAAGEYAVPQLLKVVTSGGNPSLEVQAVQVLESLRRFAVMPLGVALEKLDPLSQRKVADILGEIGYPAAAPFLVELAGAAGTPVDVREAAQRALTRLSVQGTSSSAQFAQLARRFFDGDDSLVPYPSEETNNVWSYDTFAGLTPTPVPTAIFNEVMTMLMARRSLGHDAANMPALALYVAGDLRRENRLPSGVDDPIFGGSSRSPAFFAMAAGPRINQSVIGLALDRKDTALVRDGIAALAETAGTTTLLDAGSARQPLLECLRYPERRVRYEAALAVGNALPDSTFPGDFSVVPILASAVRDADSSVGAVLASAEEDRRQLAGRLVELGLAALSGAETFAGFEPELAASSGLDLLVAQGTVDAVTAAVASARLSPMTSAVPVLAVVADADVTAAMRAFAADPGVVVWPASGSPDSFRNAVDAVFAAQSGGRMADDEALEYTIRSLEALRRIAISRSPVFSIADAEQPLLEALEGRSGGVRLMVADVLALLPGPTVQRRLIDAAMDASDEGEKIELLGHAAAHARRFGNLAEPRQIEALADLVAVAGGSLADAAGRLYGALDLSTDGTVRLITGGGAPAPSAAE